MATDLEKQTKEIYAAMNAHDLEKFLSYHSDDVVVTMADGTQLRGKDEVRHYFTLVLAAFSDVRADLTSCFSSGNRQCEEYVISGKHTGEYMGVHGTGKSFSYRTAAVREVRDGKTCKVSSYSDSMTLLRQLGITPVLPQK
ncbi:MAG: hypothetical protein H6Q07_362 [Acidobacteria bacterium]|jgi:steroid delta-isomerase-like uncharacterized protein|nr:hypothetical protein [Acidobacteriota bacterium]